MHRRAVVALGEEELGELEARIEVGVVEADAPREEVGGRQRRRRFAGFQPRADLLVAGLLLRARRERVEVRARRGHLVALEQHPRQVEARGGVRGIERDRVLQVILGDGELALGERFARRAVLDLGGVGNEAVEEGAHERFGLRSHELRDRVPVDEGDGVGDRREVERLHQLGIGVGVDVHELEAPAVLALEALHQRPEHLARLAPRRPEVHDHGDFRGRLDAVALER